ncbi:hypothetical protein DFH07DRAFT_1056449 [Mycena maculata]|uniref:Uncharacterized protein n=1 Tax=Mycena maculata TaxID=230809 RepID=A0AAD7K5T0_9AGAR|nr:hypothetical protein DFH07DRAFT_1056449 [Mycena maculata]
MAFMILNIFWNFNNLDPYKATGYDCLHFFDGGIWGRHMWPLIKGYLQSSGLASKFNANMATPRVGTISSTSRPLPPLATQMVKPFSIFSSVPCIVQLLPQNSCLVRVIRTMVKVRIMLGLEVVVEIRLELLRKFIADYERICKDVSETHSKSFNFLKQHFLSHAISCFKDKGTSRNQNTRDVEHQMSIMDENEETMAWLDMKVNEWQKSQEEDETEPVLPPHTAQAHWRLGSADTQMTSTRIPHPETQVFKWEPVVRPHPKTCGFFAKDHFFFFFVVPSSAQRRSLSGRPHDPRGKRTPAAQTSVPSERIPPPPPPTIPDNGTIPEENQTRHERVD